MIGELAWLAASVMFAGIVTGILAGLFGIGGGAVIVPVLFEVFRVLGVPEAVACSSASAPRWRSSCRRRCAPTARTRSAGSCFRRSCAAGRCPRWRVSSSGRPLPQSRRPTRSRLAFVLIACLIAAKFLIGSEGLVLGNELPGPAAMTCYGFAIGLGSSLMGISGGSLVTIILTLYRTPIHSAVATAAGLGVPITLAGTIGYVLAGLPHQALLPPLSLGFVSLIGVVLVAPLSSWVAPFGARLAHRLPKRNLEIAFGLFLLLVASRFLVSLVESAL